MQSCLSDFLRTRGDDEMQGGDCQHRHSRDKQYFRVQDARARYETQVREARHVCMCSLSKSREIKAELFAL